MITGALAVISLKLYQLRQNKRARHVPRPFHGKIILNYSLLSFSGSTSPAACIWALRRLQERS